MIYLIAEQDHALRGKDLIEFSLLSKLTKEDNICCISFELDSKPKGEGWFQFIFEKAKREGIDVIFSDKRDFDGYKKEIELEERLKNLKSKKSKFYPRTLEYKEYDEKIAEILKELRPLERENLRMRNEFTANCINDYLKDKDGSLVHFCGLSHVPGLKKNLSKLRYDVKVIVIPNLPEPRPIYFPQNIIYVNGDLLEAKVDAIAHGVAHKEFEDMGTGIAKQINQKWPTSYKRFKSYRKKDFSRGDVFVDELTDPIIIYIATQPDLTHAELNFLEKGLKNLAKEITNREISSIALPKIGCGYGKLEWKEVEPLIKEYLSGIDALIMVYV